MLSRSCHLTDMGEEKGGNYTKEENSGKLHEQRRGVETTDPSLRMNFVVSKTT